MTNHTNTKAPQAYTFRITNNGREVENLNPGIYATEKEAARAGLQELSDLCPLNSPIRRFYRVETIVAKK